MTDRGKIPALYYYFRSH